MIAASLIAAFALVTTPHPDGAACAVGTTADYAIRDPDADLLTATGFTPLAESWLAVTGAPPSQVSIFTVLGGRLAARGGRVGGGPGEFRAMEPVGTSGDSLVVWDRRLKRVSLVTTRARVARSFPFALDQASSALAYDIQPLAMLDPRRLLLIGRQGVGLDAATGIRRDSVSYLGAALGGSRASLLAKFAGPEMATLRLGAGMLSVVERPLGAPLLVAPWQGGILVNADGAPTLHQVSASGTITRWPLQLSRRPTSREAVQRAREAAVDASGDLPVEIIDQIRAAVAKIEAPEALPVIDRMLPGGHFVWVREAFPAERGERFQRWHRLGAGGQAAGTLDLPVGWDVKGFESGRVIALTESQDGEGVVRGWAIRCP